MDYLHIRIAPVIGYSDGGIIGLEMAIHHGDRVTSIFAYGANSNPDALTFGKPSPAQAAVDAASEAWSRRVYFAESPRPKNFKAVEARITRMWATQPHLTGAQLKSITVPVWIVDGDRDSIKRSDTDFMARSLPLGKELILPGATHYALWQYPDLFDSAVFQFLKQP